MDTPQDHRQERRLSGRRILITGAGSGIGRETARLCVRQGARVALVGRTRSKLSLVADEIGGEVIEADVTDEAQVRHAIALAARALDGLDGVVNAAGATWMRPTLDTPIERWREMLDLHMTATFLVCREAIPALLQSTDSAIVNISSVAGLLPGISGSAYAAAKAGQIVFSKALAVELAPKVRVNVLCAGPTNTPLSNPNFDAMREAGTYEAFMRLFPLGRIASTPEIARIVTFLISSEASYVTGAAWTADGGRSLH
jgi:NAD(P)-dependent dehydrogenase (short-subunit alcohol dehydrogenase family)